MQSRLFICIFISAASLCESLTQLLSSDRYHLQQVYSLEELRDFVEENSEQIDCLIVFNEPSIFPLFNQLYEQGTLLPAIIIESASAKLNLDTSGEKTINSLEKATCLYHIAEVRLLSPELSKITLLIDQAIAKFLYLGPSCSLSEQPITTMQHHTVENKQSFLLLQQRRLAEKLKERLGYLGVYYKRNPQYFYRNLSQKEKKELLVRLSSEYRQIILNYFSPDYPINQEIDQLVNQAFFADIAVSQVLEIHMELMDDFAQQLKLEGRSEEILLDYRLALIDVIAHLGEMYRRSIPREDIPFDLLFSID